MKSKSFKFRMMNKNLFKSVLIIGICTFLAGYGSNLQQVQSDKRNTAEVSAKSTENKITSGNQQKNILELPVCIDTTYTYKDMNSLVDASKYIVEAKVIDVKASINNDTDSIYTTARIQVIKEFTGKLNKGEYMEVTYNGGALEGNAAKDYLRAVQIQKYGEVQDKNLPQGLIQKINELSNIDKGDEAIFFISGSKGQYYLTGDYQGRYKIINGEIEKNEDLRLPDTERVYKAVYSPISLVNKDMFIGYIKICCEKKYLKQKCLQ